MHHFASLRSRYISRNRRLPWRARLALEPLEERRLLSATTPDALDFGTLRAEPESYASTHILVRLRDEAAAPANVYGLELMRGLNLWRVEVGQGSSVPEALNTYLGRNDVLYAQPDYTVGIADHQSPNDVFYEDGSLWGLNNVGQNGGTGDADIDAPEAWHVTTGSSGVVAAVIDTGVDYTHPDLAANVWVNPGEIGGDGIDNDGNGYIDDIHGYDFVNNDGDPMDDHSHGTHVAGTIGAAGNNDDRSGGKGMVGVAWDVSIMGLKFLSSSGSGSTSNAIRALDYATQMRGKGVNVRVTNNSWGGGGYEQALKDAIDRSGAAGILFAAAAGNGDFLGRAQDNDAKPHYPSSYESTNIVAVAASDRNDKLASFSNYGATSVDLAAPGAEIWSTIPFAKDTGDGTKDGYARYSGTSMATPHVSGAAALMWSVNPDLTVTQVKEMLVSPQYTDYIGNETYGKPTVTNGRLNVAKLVEHAAALGTPALSIDDVTVVEGHSGTVQAVFTVTRSGNTSQSMTVDFATQDGTATATLDYEPAAGTLLFAAGETAQTVTVLVHGDLAEEIHEAFFVNLSNPVNATIIDGRGEGTILDDDGPQISISDATVIEGDSGTTGAVFTVSLSKASLFDMAIRYATADGSATAAGQDYVAASGTVTIAAGSTKADVTVTVNGDTDYEPDETFYVNLTNPTHGSLADAQGAGTIINDDSQPIGDANDMYVRDITWSETASGRWTDLFVTVDVNRDSDADAVGEAADGPAAGASASLVLIHDTNGDGVYGNGNDKKWNGSGTTQSDGTVVFKLSKARSGNYKAEVTGLTHTSFTWNSQLDGENPDYYRIGAGELGQSNGSRANASRLAEIDALFANDDLLVDL